MRSKRFIPSKNLHSKFFAETLTGGVNIKDEDLQSTLDRLDEMKTNDEKIRFLRELHFNVRNSSDMRHTIGRLEQRLKQYFIGNPYGPTEEDMPVETLTPYETSIRATDKTPKKEPPELELPEPMTETKTPEVKEDPEAEIKATIDDMIKNVEHKALLEEITDPTVKKRLKDRMYRMIVKARKAKTYEELQAIRRRLDGFVEEFKNVFDEQKDPIVGIPQELPTPETVKELGTKLMRDKARALFKDIKNTPERFLPVEMLPIKKYIADKKVKKYTDLPATMQNKFVELALLSEEERKQTLEHITDAVPIIAPVLPEAPKIIKPKKTKPPGKLQKELAKDPVTIKLVVRKKRAPSKKCKLVKEIAKVKETSD